MRVSRTRNLRFAFFFKSPTLDREEDEVGLKTQQKSSNANAWHKQLRDESMEIYEKAKCGQDVFTNVKELTYILYINFDVDPVCPQAEATLTYPSWLATSLDRNVKSKLADS